MRDHRRLAALLAALVPLLASASSLAAPKLEQHFTRAWHSVEVIVFLRPAEHDYLNEERLTGAPTPLAASLQSFRLPPAEQMAQYALAPLTRAQLTFPYLDASRLDLFAPLPSAADERGEPGTGWPEGRDTARGETPPSEAAAGLPPPAISPRLAPDPLLDFLRQVADFEAALERDSYRPLAAETFTLTGEAQALRRRGGYRILLHRRWHQPVPPREAPQPLFVQAGTRYDDGFALEGTLEITQGRYLHFGAHLLYREPLLGRAPLDRALPPPRSAPGLDTSESPFLLAPAQLERAGYMELKENRRISDDQLSYFDHPKLGLLVRVQPVPPPPALVEAHRLLEEKPLSAARR